jgi:hypothetical protein
VTITIESEPDASLDAQSSVVHMIDLIKDLPGHILFSSPEEVEEYIREERDSWDQ